MTALRQLSVFYVATAGAYAIAMAMSAHPNWVSGAEATGSYIRSHTVAAAEAFDDHILRPDFLMAEHAGRALSRSLVAVFERTPAHVAHFARARPPQHRLAAVQTEMPAPPANTPDTSSVPSQPAPPETSQTPAVPPPAATASSEQPPANLRGSNATPPTDGNAAPPATTPAPPTNTPQPNAVASLPPAPNAGEIVRVQERLKDSLTSEMFDSFGLFLYVSKANAGPWSQRMYVFQKATNGDLNLLYNWPVSTGREQIETNPEGRKLVTSTPPGYYELDPHRSYEHYRSAEWDQEMPYAMFFKWEKDHNETGLAIHAATGDDVAKLGHRASAGCVHLSEDNARTLFTMIRSQYKGPMPRFAYDRRTGTMSNQGIMLHDANGNPQMAQGYKVLVFIEDYGGQNVIAALY